MQRYATSGLPASLVALALLILSQPCPAAENSVHAVQVKELKDRVRVEYDGQLFTEYFFKDVPRPYCYPVIGPGGERMTRAWPLETAPDEERDHKHHKSLWFAHGSVNGYDFWSEEKNFGKTVHQGFTAIQSGEDRGLISSTNNWVAADGKLVCSDERTLTFYRPLSNGTRFMDFDITLHALGGDVVFGDTKEGTMAIRLAETMRLKGKVGKGHIVTSAGDHDGETWGKRAEWCDYYGPVNGNVVGVAIFDHPQNPRHPTWWHVRDYGLFAANPFGRHDFEQLKDKHAGDLTVPAHSSVTFRYRFVFHKGTQQEAKIGDLYETYAKSQKR